MVYELVRCDWSSDVCSSVLKRKRITEKFFLFLLTELYGEKDWKQLSYKQMYELIYILTHYDYKE